MSNPYRDEHGRYCSANEMMDAVLRLQLDGKTIEAVALMADYQQIARKARMEQPKPVRPNINDWNRQWSHLRPGEPDTATQMEKGFAPLMGTRRALEGLYTHQATLPVEVKESTKLIWVEENVLPIYSAQFPGGDHVAHLAVIEHQGGLYALKFGKDARENINIPYDTAYHAVGQPVQKEHTTREFRSDESVESNKEALDLFTSISWTTEAGEQKNLSDAFYEGHPRTVQTSRGEANLEFLHEENRIEGQVQERAVLTINGDQYMVNRVQESWADQQVLTEARKGKFVTSTETYLHFDLVGTTGWDQV